MTEFEEMGYLDGAENPFLTIENSYQNRKWSVTQTEIYRIFSHEELDLACTFKMSK